ncbi:hypothetical protein K4749_34400 [Streptomyces sp. TRM72054]|uniref:hypothetical protein n=1 Tax=Streptomyces sp. TRM72054 TaxID=2870562 RepID=UPI001C8B3BD0|nr:hypothetical protein [Streptomyces sp. TRM72054]MBX9398538.1 hypothetical protein [Streptomyces sp. TRM72054]
MQSQAVALAAELAALTGHAACTEEFVDRIRVRAALPAHLTDICRRSLLVALARADRYGHDVTAQGAHIWAEIDAGRPGSGSSSSSMKGS